MLENASLALPVGTLEIGAARRAAVALAGGWAPPRRKAATWRWW